MRADLEESLTDTVYRTVFEPLGALAGDPRLGSLGFALANVALYTALAAAMDRRRLYVKV